MNQKKKRRGMKRKVRKGKIRRVRKTKMGERKEETEEKERNKWRTEAGR